MVKNFLLKAYNYRKIYNKANRKAVKHANNLKYKFTKIKYYYKRQFTNLINYHRRIFTIFMND